MINLLASHAAKHNIIRTHVSGLLQEPQCQLRAALAGINHGQAAQQLCGDAIRSLDLLTDRRPGRLKFRKNQYDNEGCGQAGNDQVQAGTQLHR